MFNITVENFVLDPGTALKYISENCDKIPCINCPEDVVEGGLFRFRCMVQDMLNPVYFYSKYEVLDVTTGARQLRSGKFRDCIDCSDNETLLFDTENCVNEERKPYVCISIPGLNDWAKKFQYTGQTPSEKLPAEKRNIEEEMDVDHETNKRVKTEHGTVSINEKHTRLTLPIMCPTNVTCIVHFYDTLSSGIKVTDIIETVGFAYRNSNGQDESDLPASSVPRIHAVFIRKFETSNPLYPSLTNTSEIVNQAKALRAELHLVLSQLFLGDRLSADYLICYLLSRVYTRNEWGILGKFALNLTDIPNKTKLNVWPYVAYIIIEKLVPKSHLFSMTIENMNKTDMTPRKDYDTDKLESGLLQLSKQTFLVIDETKLDTGKLDDKGVRNVNALNKVITEQKCNYDFKYYGLDFETDIPILVISNGKSILQTDCRVPIKSDSNCSMGPGGAYESVINYLQEPLLSKLRLYLTAMSFLDFNIPEDMSKKVQEELVNLRKCYYASPESLHTMLTIARWTGLSYGEVTLTDDIWKKVVDMETERRERLLELP